MFTFSEPSQHTLIETIWRPWRNYDIIETVRELETIVPETYYNIKEDKE